MRRWGYTGRASRVYPRLCVLPIGWAHTLNCCQRLHATIISEVLPESCLAQDHHRLRLSRFGTASVHRVAISRRTAWDFGSAPCMLLGRHVSQPPGAAVNTSRVEGSRLAVGSQTCTQTSQCCWYPFACTVRLDGTCCFDDSQGALKPTRHVSHSPAHM